MTTFSRIVTTAALLLLLTVTLTVDASNAQPQLRRRQETTEDSHDATTTTTTSLDTSATASSTIILPATSNDNKTYSEPHDSLICLILTVHVSMATGEEDHLECDLISEDHGMMIHGLQINLPEKLVQDNHKALHRGEWYVQIYGGAKIEETHIEGYGSLKTGVHVPRNAKIITLAPEEGDVYTNAVGGTRSSRYLLEPNDLTGRNLDLNETERHLLVSGRQYRKVMVARVWVSNAGPTYSAAQLQQYFFDMNSYSFARQYALCSSSWMYFTGARGSNSVVNVYVPGNAGSFTKENLWKAALNNLQAQLRVSSITSIAQHMVFVLPSGLQGGVWYGAGTVNSWRSIFSNTFGGIPNTLMHEIGHNLGLGHAGRGADQYADATSIMGYGAFNQFGPSKCFNGGHLWGLGWFKDKTVEINPFNHAIVQIGSFADYSKLTRGQYVVVKVGDFYLVFNRASGVNSGTGEAQNLITVSQLHNGQYTTRVGAIGPSTGLFQVGRYAGSNGSLMIKVCRIFPWNGIQIAQVSIGVNNANCS